MDYFNFRIRAIKLPCHALHGASHFISFGTACTIERMHAGDGAENTHLSALVYPQHLWSVCFITEQSTWIQEFFPFGFN